MCQSFNLCRGQKNYSCDFQTSHSPAPVDELHRLHRQCRGDDVVGVVPPPAHHNESVHFPGDEDEAARADEAQQAGPHEGVLADQPPAGAHRVNLPTHNQPALELQDGAKIRRHSGLTFIPASVEATTARLTATGSETPRWIRILQCLISQISDFMT